MSNSLSMWLSSDNSGGLARPTGSSILGAYEDLPEGLSDDELRGIGVNRADVHTDLMIGSDEVEVDGLHNGGDAVPLLREGDWQLS